MFARTSIAHPIRIQRAQRFPRTRNTASRPTAVAAARSRNAWNASDEPTRTPTTERWAAKATRRHAVNHLSNAARMRAGDTPRRVTVPPPPVYAAGCVVDPLVFFAEQLGPLLRARASELADCVVQIEVLDHGS